MTTQPRNSVQDRRFCTTPVILPLLHALLCAFAWTFSGCGLPSNTVPTLTFASVGEHTMKDAQVVISASSESPASVHYSLLSGPATLVGDIVTFTGPGQITIEAKQEAYGRFLPAAVTLSFAVTLAPNNLSILPIADHPRTAPSFVVVTQGVSPAPVVLSVASGPASILNNVLTVTGTGLVTVQAAQPATTVYASAIVTASFSVTPTQPTITIHDSWTAAGTILLTASSPSPGVITYTVLSGSATLMAASTLSVTGPGIIVVRADQASTADYTAASTSSTISVSAATVVPAPTSIQFVQQTVGSASAPATITLQNPGDLSAPLQSITVPSGYLLSNTCSTSIAAHSSCIVGVTFAPATAGTDVGQVTIKSDATSALVDVSGTAIGVVQPSLVSASPSSIQAGTQTELHLVGDNLDQVNEVIAGSTHYSITHINPREISALLSPSSWAAGDIGVTAVAPSGQSNTLMLSLLTPTVPFDTAVRFAQQASMAVTPDQIKEIQTRGLAGWIDWQLTTPMYPYESRTDMAYATYMANTQNSQYALRQRMTLALKKIYVLGPSSRCFEGECGHYWEALLQKDAFGNERDLLKDITVSPLLGNFLNNAENWMEYPYTGIRRANQNYARELMQLMTIGPVQLDSDGSTFHDANGQVVLTYSEDNVSDMAAAMSGYWSANLDFFAQLLPGDPLIPMVPNESAHSPLPKNPLPGLQLPASQGATVDTTMVLDALFNHENTAPFLVRRLIQSFVSSNPSPQYIARIADVFKDDGSGTRGNLAAVVKAILLDPEAREGDDPTTTNDNDSHMMEPLLYITNVVAATGANYTDDRIYLVTGPLGEDLFVSPSVFGPYSPDNRVPTGEFAPEAQLVSTSGYITRLGFVNALVTGGTYGVAGNLPNSPFYNAPDAASLIEQMRHYLYHGRMPQAVQDALQAYVAANSTATPNALLPGLCMIALSNSSYQVIR